MLGLRIYGIIRDLQEIFVKRRTHNDLKSLRCMYWKIYGVWYEAVVQQYPLLDFNIIIIATPDVEY